MSLSENNAVFAIMDFDRVRRNLCLPRYTPSDWWECDVCELTAANTFREYEVKLTLSDFKNDAKKADAGRYNWKTKEYEGKTNKHDLLAKGDPCGPAQFWFVAPVDLISQVMLPNWAGLMELRDRGEGHRPTHRWGMSEKVKAPKLHGGKAHAKFREHVFACCYYRFHAALRSNVDSTVIRREWSDEVPPAFIDSPSP